MGMHTCAHTHTGAEYGYKQGLCTYPHYIHTSTHSPDDTYTHTSKPHTQNLHVPTRDIHLITALHRHTKHTATWQRRSLCEFLFDSINLSDS